MVLIMLPKAWFTSFFTNRKQVTICNDVCSKVAPVSIGVAQGSILGPLLFIIYINDLPDVLQFCQVTLNADDTVLYLASKSTVDLQSKIYADLRRICKWLPANQLTLNVKKSKFLLIGSSSRLSKVGSILISADDIPLDNVDSYTYLGIVINNWFSWTDHIDYIRGKISEKLSLLRHIKSYLPLNARIMFFNSFILPLFDYGDIIWGDRGNASLMSELQVLQNKAARLILDLAAQFSSAEAGSHYCDVERNIMLFLCLNILTTISVTLSLSHSMVIFIVTTQDREMTFANLVPQEDGVIGRQ